MGNTIQETMINKQVDAIMQRIATRANRRKNAIATIIYRRIISTSPLWSGAYVDSHHIGIGRTNTRVSKIQTGLYNRASNSKARQIRSVAMARELSRLKKASLNHKIIISNSIKHAKNIEYLGFKRGTFTSPPRYVYKQALNNFRMNEKFSSMTTIKGKI